MTRDELRYSLAAFLCCGPVACRSDVPCGALSDYQVEVDRALSHPRLSRALALLDRIGDEAADALIAGEAAVVAWPPSGSIVQACADDVNPYAETAEQYGLTVEQVCDILSTFHAAGRLDRGGAS